MKKIIYLIAVLISVSFIFYSCKESSNPVNVPSAETNGLVPLTIGNSWTYKVTTYDTTGLITRIDTITYFIKSDTIINDQKWYLEDVKDGVMVGHLAGRNDSSGYFISNFQGYSKFYPYPAEVGTSINGITVVKNDSLIETTLGARQCYIYSDLFFYYSYIDIFAPGVGLIYQENPGKSYNSNEVYIAQTNELILCSLVIIN